MFFLTELGARLKEARLAKGYSLDDLQEMTKIQKRYLIGIEEGNYSIMPGSFYVRAFIKQYAEAVGLDADQLFMDYRKEVPEVQKEEVAQSFSQSPSRRRMASSTSNKTMEAMPKMIAALFLIVILVVSWTLMVQRSGKTPDETGDSDKSFEYAENDKAIKDKPKDTTEPTDEEDTETNNEPEEPIVEDPIVKQVITPGAVNGENTVYEVTGTDTLNIRLVVSGDTWLGIRNEATAGKRVEEQITDRVYKAGEVVENDSTANAYARIRLGNSKVVKVFVNDVELTYAQDRTTQNIILKLVTEQQGQ